MLINYIRDLQARLALQKVSAAYDLHTISQSELSKYNDRPFYVLGCGTTINQLGDDQWQQIAKGFSVGMNKWLVHDFVPDALSFEKKKSIPIYERLLIKERIEGSRLKFIFYPFVSLEGKAPAFNISEEILSRFRIHTAARKIIRSAKDMNEFSGKQNFLEHISSKLRHGLIYEQKGSVYRLMQIALASGFKDIVFCGVDLNNAKYFWDDQPEYFIKRGIQPFSTVTNPASAHATDIGASNSLPISEVIEIFSRNMNNHGVRFWTTSTESKLAGFLPVWDFKGVK